MRLRGLAARVGGAWLPSRPLVAVVVLLPALVVGVVAVCALMGVPRPDVEQLAAILALSGAASLALGAGAVRWGSGRGSGLRWRLGLAYGVGLLVTLVNVVVAAATMFISRHDLTLLLLLLGFGAGVSLVFGYGVIGAAGADLSAVARAARRLAAGDLQARVGASARGADEIARLAAAFDDMAAQLEAAFERERALDAERREMVAAVSHDLRTPLTTIRAMVEAITDGVVSEPDEIRRYLTLTRGEVEHLSRLIDDLFELSQIESGALELDLAPTRLDELLAETVAAYQAPARDGRITLEHAAEPGIPPVAADPARLMRVVRNLLDNALHHTPAGGSVRIEARRLPAAAGAAAVQVSVRDTGPGLADEDVERVFDRFYRGAGARDARTRAAPAPADEGRAGAGARRSTGAGLGLTIARGLVQAHGGRIWAERAAGSGAIFHFTLPVAAGSGR